MATKQVVCEVLYSGQGMCNLIKLIDDTDAISHLILIDFGADLDSVTVEGSTLPYLVKTINAHGRIDVLIVSHTDTDHWNLMPKLLGQLNPTVKITKAASPIGDWTGKKATFEAQLKKRMLTGKGYKKFDSAFTDIKAKTIDTWWDESDVTLSILCASVKRADVSKRASPATIDTNTASVVVRCKFGTNTVVFCADATSFTLQYINKQMGDFSFGGTNLMCTVPHHGSISTLHGRLDVLEEFAEKLEPQCVLASAEMKRRLNHPNACVVSSMSEHLRPAAFAGEHDMVLYFQKKSVCGSDKLYEKILKGAQAIDKSKLSAWLAYQDERNVFTTLADKTTIYPRWLFALNKDNSTSVEYKSTKTLSRTRAAQALTRAEEERFFVVGDRAVTPLASMEWS